MTYPDECDLERSHELEARLDRDAEREPVELPRRRVRHVAGLVDRTPANSNATKPIVILEPTGNGTPLYRALARVIVRSAIFATAIPPETDCEAPRAAG